MAKAFYPSTVQLWANVLRDGFGSGVERKLPVIECRTVFAVNAIPVCTLILAYGRHAITGEPAETHKLNYSNIQGKYIEVMCKLSGSAGVMEGREVQWPSREFCIFKGRISGEGSFEKSHNNAHIVLPVDHWLVDLDNTNWMNCLMDEQSPDSLASAATFNSYATSPGQQLPLTTLNEVKSISTGVKNVWTDSLKLIIEKVAKFDLPSMNNRWGVALGSAGVEPQNSHVIKALKMMDNPGHMVIPEMPLFGGIREDADMAEFVGPWAQSMASIFFSDSDKPSLWSKLLRVLAVCMDAAIVPVVETATIAPLTPTGNTPWLTVDATDIVKLQTFTRLTRWLRGVILLPSEASPYGIRPSGDGDSKYNGFCGRYDVLDDINVSKTALAEGRFMVRKGPWWLNSPSKIVRMFPTSISAANNRSRSEAQASDRAAMAAYDIGSRLAKSIYMKNVYGQRHGVLQTRLRFDIAPGSMLHLEAPRMILRR